MNIKGKTLAFAIFAKVVGGFLFFLLLFEINISNVLAATCFCSCSDGNTHDSIPAQCWAQDCVDCNGDPPYCGDWYEVGFCGGGGGGTEYWDPVGTRFRFVYFDHPDDVPSWPITGTSGASGWVEETLTGQCNALGDGPLEVPGLLVRAWVYRRHSGKWDTIEADMIPDVPNCTNDYNPGVSQTRATTSRQDPDYYPTWQNHKTWIQTPESADYRQFGIKISDDPRPVYRNYYSWLDENGQKSWVYRFTGHQLEWWHDVRHQDPPTDWDAGYGRWPGFPSKGIIRTDLFDPFGDFYAWAAKTKYTKEHDDGKRDCTGSSASCPSGYVKVQATNYVDPDQCHREANEYNVFTCKRVVNNELLRSDWRPETDDGAITFDRNSWSADRQTRRIWQDFEFTVDRSGTYFFTPCHDCSASMTINGSWDGFQDHAYEEGKTYSGHFECTDGDCYYGIAPAPRSVLAPTTSLSTVIWVPFINKNQPEPQPVVGNIYERTDDTCSIDEASLSSVAADISCTYGGGSAEATLAAGEYTCVNPDDGTTLFPAGSTVDVAFNQDALPIGYTLACQLGSSLVTVPDDNTPGEGPDYILTQLQDAWFQAQGGDLHADSTGGGVTIQSEIPDTCSLPDCDPNLVKQDAVTGQAGAVSRASGTQEFGSGSVSADGWQAEAGSYEGLRADYAFWLQHLSDELVSQEITNDPGPGFWLSFANDLTIGANWDVGAAGTEKLVLLVPNNVQISANQTVAPGSSLLIVAGGTISFAPTVTQAQGIYIANNINTGTGGANNDSQFVGEGTFIGWNGISLQRDLGADVDGPGPDLGNADAPGELFIYNPEVVYNLPTEVKRSLYTWREVS